MADSSLISIVIPVFNEEENIDPLYERIRGVIDPLGPEYDFEILFTDNHSTDRTFERIAELVP